MQKSKYVGLFDHYKKRKRNKKRKPKKKKTQSKTKFLTIVHNYNL